MRRTRRNVAHQGGRQDRHAAHVQSASIGSVGQTGDELARWSLACGERRPVVIEAGKPPADQKAGLPDSRRPSSRQSVAISSGAVNGRNKGGLTEGSSTTAISQIKRM